MKKFSHLVAGCAVLFGCAMPCSAAPIPNLVPDASFEAPTAAWFSQAGQGRYFAGKEKVAGATQGQFVLAIQGWEAEGSKILSPAFALTGDAYSATLQFRSFVPTQGATLELALFDEKGEAKLASFGTVALDGAGQWKTLGAANISVQAAAGQGRLALVVGGPQKGGRIEVDSVGLFEGAKTDAVVANTDFSWFEAEEMANGKNWIVKEHFATWYTGVPNRMKMLDGAVGEVDANETGGGGRVTHAINARRAGLHRLWVRFLHVIPPNGGTFTFSVTQGGKTVASREVDESDTKLGAAYTWVWASLDVPLSAGAAEVVLSRPQATPSWLTRKIDLFGLTNDLSYQPKIEDFVAQGFVRFTNTTNDQQPFCLWTMVSRSQGPTWYVYPGILSQGGFSDSHYVPADKTKWIAPGQSSPWVNISQYLSPGVNRTQFIATRQDHTQGLLQSAWRGRLEFAVGDDRRVVKTVEVNQNAPRLLMTLPADFQEHGDEILTGLDYIRRGEAALDASGVKPGPVAKYLDLNAIIHLDAAIDDPRIIEREHALIKRLGFNGTYTPVVDAKKAAAYAAARGMAQHFGMTIDITHLAGPEGCQNDYDIPKITAAFKEQATRFGPLAAKMERMKLADEPNAMSYAHIVAHDLCRAKFAADLKAAGFTPQQLGVASWSEVVPTLPSDKEKSPELFYQTGLFRLRSFANFWKRAVAIKKQFFPDNVKTYVNYSPPLSEDMTWTARGNDLFMTQRNGGLELGWTEDWLGYGASPQHISPLYAHLRAAAAPTGQPLGGYVIGVSGNTLIQRIKYYEMVAGGARHIDVYSYGPYYAGGDTWGASYELFPVFARVQREMAVIDQALHGTVRRKTDVAILYNRTAGIWATDNSATEQDSRYTHWALAHAGFDAAFIPEEDVLTGQLKNYKVLYLNGVQLQRAAATAIADWVRRGGVLFGSAGAGSRDEFNRPLATLEAVFGAQSRDLKLQNDVGRPKYELRSLPILDVLATLPNSGTPSVSLNQLSYSESLIPSANAKVILKNKAGAAAGILHSFGKGRAVRIAAIPGVAYLNDAVRDKGYDADTHLPQNYRSELRDFIAWPALLARAARVATTPSPITEITRYDGPNRAVLFVVDHNARPRADFKMEVPNAAHFTKAYTASGKPLRLTKHGKGKLQIAWPLDVADAVVLHK